MPWYLVLGVVAVLGIVALVTHLLLTMFNKRGWVYYRDADAPKAVHLVDQEIPDEFVSDHTESGDPGD